MRIVELLTWLPFLGWFPGEDQHGHSSVNDGGTLNGNAALLAGTLGTGPLKTATGSATSAGVGTNITMHDYTFFPSISDTAAGNVSLLTQSSADPGNTVGRFFTGGTGTAGTVRWRYLTASDDPTIWCVHDTVSGALLAVWTADDPTDGPGVVVDKLTAPNASGPLKLGALDLAALTIPAGKLAAADALIRAKGWSLEHRLYRALQIHADDPAPSKWIFDNCRIANGVLIGK